MTRKRPTVSSAFREDRATEATAVLVDLGGGELEVTTLSHLLYLFDRLTLTTTLRPSFYGQYRSLEDGPAVAEITEMLKGGNSSSLWWRHFCVSRHRVKMKSRPLTKSLSRGDRRRLHEVFNEWASLNLTAFIEGIRQRCPEWVKHSGEQFSWWDILVESGVATPQQADSIVEQISAEREFSNRCGFQKTA